MNDDQLHNNQHHSDHGAHDALPDEALDRLIVSARASYHVPPAPDLDALWRGVEAQRGRRGSQTIATRWWRVAGIAAAIVLAFTLGRVSVRSAGVELPMVASAPGTGANTASIPPSNTPGNTPVTTTTSELLGQTAVLLAALPADGADPASDRRFAQQAGELLTTTRLLLSSRATESDPALRRLLEDLELMLAQVARLRAGETRTERELITEALQQQNLVPRIRTIAAGLGAGAD